MSDFPLIFITHKIYSVIREDSGNIYWMKAFYWNAATQSGYGLTEQPDTIATALDALSREVPSILPVIHFMAYKRPFFT